MYDGRGTLVIAMTTARMTTANDSKLRIIQMIANIYKMLQHVDTYIGDGGSGL